MQRSDLEVGAFTTSTLAFFLPPPSPPPPLSICWCKLLNTKAPSTSLRTVDSIGKARDWLAVAEAKVTNKAFQPCHMFFYDSLMDLEVI
jgi:hypothetical protein